MRFNSKKFIGLTIFILAFVIFNASFAYAQSYEIIIHPSGPAGGDLSLVCKKEGKCQGSVDLVNHQPFKVEGHIDEHVIALSFFQTGMHLPVLGPGGKKTKAFFAVPLDAFNAANPISNRITVYAPDAINDAPYPAPQWDEDDRKIGLINPVITHPGSLPVTIETSIRRVNP